MTDISDAEGDNLIDFNLSSFDEEETLEECFASSAFVKIECRIDGKHLSKVWKIVRKSGDRTTFVTT